MTLVPRLSRPRQVAALIEGVLAAEPARRPLLIGIDGCGAAGKSTLAMALVELLPAATAVVPMDDFYKPSTQRLGVEGPEAFDLEQLRDRVLVPLRQGRAGCYRPYDWTSDRLATAWRDVPVATAVIVEGVYSTHPLLRPLYRLRGWVDCPASVRLARGLERDGQRARGRWERDWMPAEDAYVRETRPHDTADFVFDGSGTTCE